MLDSFCILNVHFDPITTYELNPTVWDAIGVATASGGSTIPTAFGARPPDISKDRTACTADTWSFWLLYLGSILLRNKFARCVYYDHFIKFADITAIRTGFAKWAEEYEKLYYQYSPDRLSACPVTIHALLHIADGIESAGPVWAYWAFPMERFCGRLQPCIKSRRFPFASIDGHVVATAQLAIVKIKHAVDLRLGPPKLDLAGSSFAHPAYTCILLPPRQISRLVTIYQISKPESGLARKITACLSTRFDKNMATIRKYFDPDDVEQWAKVQRLDDGGRMLASSMMHSETDDQRDATYVRYALLVDVNARRQRLAPRYVLTTFYGQLQNIFVVKLPPAAELELEEESTLILAAIQKCEIEAHNDLDMHYYCKDGPIEVVDISSIQCLVGRIRTTDKKHWVIIDRSGNLARPYHDPDT
ncbi:hypothetical protein DFH07DRAFT_864335 [Mycena maculata]|uniref:Uncharacterized protein n=1 Tax=Mycena maculata TaxID=230809 RepID=A0AAD7KG50_9AGAR|nr:hypothetical protein DFH07DRAFT_864335 [Mycena maculata]